MKPSVESSQNKSSIAADCHPCILNQARSAARFAELNEEQTERVINVAQAGLEKSKSVPLLAQHIVRYVANAIIHERGETPDYDIYAEVKEKSNRLSLTYLSRFEEKIKKSKSPFERGLQVAAAGNIIDFGAKEHASLNMEEELRVLDQTSFDHYDLAALKEALSNASCLLYLCDNSGEIVFDMLFIEEIKHEYPHLEIVAAVRGRPIINDATLEDAKMVGLDRLVKTISSGSIYPGIILPETTEEFQQLFASADVILAKGQGNFETLLPMADKRLFFLLRIKCEYMAGLAGVRKDSLVLMQGREAE